jgi:methionine sulfoxide reductase heme-binding subunit
VIVLWYVTRSTGEAALLFLTAVLTLGVMSAMRVGGRRVPRFVIAGMHRNLTLVALGFLALHILSTLLDSFAPIDAVDVVVPFGSAYRPIWIGLGALAFDALVVLTVTSLLRARIGVRRWKALHWTAYACWATALVHALGTGSDTRASVFLLLAGICCALALAALAWRLAEAAPDRLGLRVGAALAALTVVTGIAIWTVRGPLQAGWAKRSGTPADLLGRTPTGTSPADGDSG